MKLILDTQPGVTIVNPTFELQRTVDLYPSDNKFQPEVLVITENIKIYHVLPPQDYVNGTWNDNDVQNAIKNYFEQIKID